MSWLTFTLDTNSVNEIGDRAAAKVQAGLADEYRQLRSDHAAITNKLDASGRLLTGIAADITAIKSDIRGMNATLTTLVTQGHDLDSLPGKVLRAVTDAANSILDTFKATEADRAKIAELTDKINQIDPKPAP